MRDLSQLKVCFIAGTLGQGGAERQLYYILKALKQSGTHVRLLSLSRGEHWEQQIRELGIGVNWVGQQGSKFSRLCRIVSSLRSQPPDIFQSQHFYTNLYAVGAARALHLHEIGAIRNDARSEWLANGRVLGRLSLRTPRFIAANSRAGLLNAIDMGVSRSRLHLLPNVVDCDQFRPASGIAVGPVRLILAGRLVKQKRVDRFLRLLSRLRQQQSIEFEAIIVGDGPLRTELERQALDMELSSTVTFKGAMADMSSIYREADVLVLTSDHEGTPNVLLEAMASGLPIVATKVGEVPEIVNAGDTGYLAKAEDEKGLLEALLKMIADRNLIRELGTRAREFVVANYSVNRLPAYLDELYRATLS